MEISQPIILFDGICNLCNGAVDFVVKHDHLKQFRFIPLQSEIAGILKMKYKIPDRVDSVILIRSGKVYFESDAIIEIMGMMNYPWKIGKTIKILPSKIRNMLYRWIAKNRYRWFGKRQNCRIFVEERNDQFMF